METSAFRGGLGEEKLTKRHERGGGIEKEASWKLRAGWTMGSSAAQRWRNMKVSIGLGNKEAAVV